MNSSIVSQLSTLNQAPPSPSRRGAGGEVSWPWPSPRLRRYGVKKPFDPTRRLIAAVAAQAVLDLIEPESILTRSEQHSAFVFLCQHRQILLDLNIPGHKLDFLAEWLEQREEVQP